MRGVRKGQVNGASKSGLAPKRREELLKGVAGETELDLHVGVTVRCPPAEQGRGGRRRGEALPGKAHSAVPYLCKAEKRLLGLSSRGPWGSTVPRSFTQCR